MWCVARERRKVTVEGLVSDTVIGSDNLVTLLVGQQRVVVDGEASVSDGCWDDLLLHCWRRSHWLHIALAAIAWCWSFDQLDRHNRAPCCSASGGSRDNLSHHDRWPHLVVCGNFMDEGDNNVEW